VGADILDLHNCIFARYDLLRTAQIVPLDCRITMQRYLPPFVIVCIDIGALQHLECEDDLTA